MTGELEDAALLVGGSVPEVALDELHAILKNLRYAFPDLIRDESSLIVSREAHVNYLPWKK